MVSGKDFICRARALFIENNAMSQVFLVPFFLSSSSVLVFQICEEELATRLLLGTLQCSLTMISRLSVKKVT